MLIAISLITYSNSNTVVQNWCKGRWNKFFRFVVTEKPLNRFTQNLAWVIMSGTPLYKTIQNGMSIASR